MKRSLILVVILIFTFSSVSFAKMVRKYFPNGKLNSTQIYDDKGIPKGPYMLYWPNGKLKRKILYKHGRPYSTRNWSEKGVLLHK